MVFSSIPIYDHQDPPNWHLHQQSYLQHEQLQTLPPSSHTDGGSAGNTAGSIRPTSMSDRARLARIPHPEAALKCPRCESTDTKFCYFNNYSLSQPRHYCKTCRRYWTRGGSLRNVPVGGGCRRNKKRSKSKSKGTGSDNRSPDHQRLKITRSSSTDLAPGDDRDNYTILGHRNYPQSPFSSSLQTLTHLGSIDPLLSGQNSVLDHQWSSNMQQFPFPAGGFDQSPAGNNLFTFQSGGGEARVAPPAIYSMPAVTSSAFRARDQVSVGAVKMEETLKYYTSSARPYDNNEEQYHTSWGGAWNKGGGSADGVSDETAAGQRLYSSAATAHFL